MWRNQLNRGRKGNVRFVSSMESKKMGREVSIPTNMNMPGQNFRWYARNFHAAGQLMPGVQREP